MIYAKAAFITALIVTFFIAFLVVVMIEPTILAAICVVSVLYLCFSGVLGWLEAK